jgi:hypothetical protein
MGGGQPFILEIPVKISPSMPNIGASTTPVVLLDGTYWATRRHPSFCLQTATLLLV